MEQAGGQGLDAGGSVRGRAGARRPPSPVREILAQGMGTYRLYAPRTPSRRMISLQSCL